MRRDLDFYETADWQGDALTDFMPELSGSVLCPTVGDGSLMRRLQKNRPDLGPFITNDIDPQRESDFHLDATDPMAWATIEALRGRCDWVIDNPPFDVEIDITKLAYTYARVGVVFMARLSFTEGTKDEKKRPRGPWLSKHPRAKQITLERYSFTGNGKSDSATTQWLVWDKAGRITDRGGFTAFGYKDGSAQRQRQRVA